MAQQGRKEFEIKSVEGLSERKEKGRGCYGAVYEVRVHGVPCIAKLLHDILVGRGGQEPVGREQRAEVIKKFREECNLLSRLRHPNVVQFLGVHYGQDEADISLIMEYMHMDLEHCITAYPNIPLPYKTSILRDVSYGLAYLHSKSAIHRDLNAGNILLTVSLRAKIADLGVARLFERRGALQRTKTVCPGAPDFMPPESVAELPEYDYKLDIFSVGHLILYLVNQSVPIVSDMTMTRDDFEKQQVQVGKRRTALEKMGGPNHPLYSTAVQCLSDNPDRRPTSIQLVDRMEEICKHSPVPHKNVLETHFELSRQSDQLERLNMAETAKEQMNKELQHMLRNSQAEVQTLVTTNKQLQMENVTLSRENLRLSQEKRQLMQDIENLRQEKAQLNQEKIEELLEYKNQADMYENERRKSQEVNTQLKSSNQVLQVRLGDRLKQVNTLKELISTLQKGLEQKERLYVSLRKEIEQERRQSSQLEILLNPSHQLQAKKQEKVKAEEEEKPDIPGMSRQPPTPPPRRARPPQLDNSRQPPTPPPRCARPPQLDNNLIEKTNDRQRVPNAKEEEWRRVQEERRKAEGEEEERRRIEEEKRRVEEERRRAEEEEERRRIEEERRRVEEAEEEEERRRVEEERRRAEEEERKRVEEERRIRGEEERRRAEEERTEATEEMRKAEERKRAIEEHKKEKRSVDDDNKVSQIVPTQPLQAVSCVEKPPISQHHHAVGVPSETVKQQLQTVHERRSAMCVQESSSSTTQAAQAGIHMSEEELTAGGQLKISNSMLQRGRDINASTHNSELTKKLEIRRQQSEPQLQDTDKMGTSPHCSQQLLTTVLKEKSAAVRQYEDKNTNKEEERRQLETSAATAISKPKIPPPVKSKPSRLHRNRPASEIILTSKDKPTMIADESRRKVVGKSSDESVLSAQAELPHTSNTLPRPQQQISAGPIASDKGSTDSTLKGSNSESRKGRPWSMYGTEEFMKKLEQRRNLEQSYAQSQETDISLVHHSQQPLTAKEKHPSVKHSVNERS